MTPATAVLLSQANQRTYYEWVRLQSLDQWWHWLLMVAVVGTILSGVVLLYRRDGVELPRAIRWLLSGLRMAALIGLLLYFLQLEKRSEQRTVHHSRLVMMIDTSQSMGLSDADAAASTSSQSRLSAIIDSFGNSPFLQELRARHDLIVYRFDQDEQPEELGILPIVGDGSATLEDASGGNSRAEQQLTEARRLYFVAAVVMSVSVLALVAHLILGTWVRSRDGGSWALLVSLFSLIVALVFAAIAQLRNPDVGVVHLATGKPVIAESETASGATIPTEANEIQLDWTALLQPRGAQTRIADAVRAVIDKERGGPIAGVVVISDGNQNAGQEIGEVINRSREARIPIYAIGMGSDKRPQNLRVADIEAPPRVFPGDSFTLTSFIQAVGLVGRSVKLEVLTRPLADRDQSQNSLLVEERRIELDATGEVHSEAFQLRPQEEGKYIYTVRVSSNETELDQSDNQAEITVQFVNRRTRVLLLAGGPMREYHFVRNQYFRDPQVEIDVLLQSSPTGSAQEADVVLEEFPETAEALFAYDAIVAFDPDWDQIEAPRMELLERWVAENGGGLILVGGNVHLPEWSGRRRSTPAIEILLGLYPVTFFSQNAQRLSSQTDRVGEPFPLEFTEEGTKASFLWLGDDLESSRKSWLRFPGVYGCFPVRGAKPGATVLARFSNPDDAIDNELPVYMASQFYGAGRVLYLGSGEFWRLREIDDTYFEQFYTKLLRFVSEGRLLRDSSRGVLLVGNDRCALGEVVTVRAVLQDAQHRPLTSEQVTATLIDPQGLRDELNLKILQDTPQGGTYTGQFVARAEGNYRIELVLPEANELEVLEREVQVRIPELEIESPQRNDAFLSDLARSTGGSYYVGLAPAIGNQSTVPLASAVIPQSQITYLPSIPDSRFERHWMTWLMALICGALSLEWLIRRLHRLA